RRLCASFFAQRKTGTVTFVFKCAVAAIAVEVVCRRIVCDDQIHPPVVVHIHECRRESITSRAICDSSLLADVGESAVAIVMKKMILLAGQTERPAKNVHTAILAGSFG